MSIRLLALDLDGTIVPDYHTVAPRVQAAMRAARERGVIVTLATGREYPVVKKFIAMLELSAPVICFQGALIVDPQSDAVLTGTFIEAPTARRLVELARAKNLALYLYPGDQAYTEQATPASRALFAEIESPMCEVADLMQTLERPPIKALIIEDPAAVPAVMRDLQQLLAEDPVDVTRSLDSLIEVVPQGVSKGRALAELAARLGIPREAVMAVGDQDNDVEMLTWAGVGVAMGNASRNAKAAARYIAPHIDEDGAAWAIEQFALTGSA